MKSAITVCLVPEARQGPFVFHEGLEAGCASAARFGFDAVEIFPRSAEDLDARQLKHLLKEHSLHLSAMGTGAGAVVHGLSLTHHDIAIRRKAGDFINGIINLAGGFGAPTIIGSLQGRFGGEVGHKQALTWLAEALEQLGPRAHAHGVPLLIEPLNRYETNLLNTIQDTVDFLQPLRTRNVKILADLFHMNIEEASLTESLKQAGSFLGHVHFADSNRRAAGLGHTDLSGVVETLREMGYDGYLSAEIFPLPDSEQAARQTMECFRRLTGTTKEG